MLQIINKSLISAAGDVFPKIEHESYALRNKFCPIIVELSKQQKELRLQIYSTTDENVAKDKKRDRNAII